jgi:hypothetical protein
MKQQAQITALSLFVVVAGFTYSHSNWVKHLLPIQTELINKKGGI